MNTDTNLPDVYRSFAHTRADASQLSLCLGNGLPQLGPAPVRKVDLPPVDLEALLLELQQHPVPGGVRFPDLIPYHLKQQEKHTSAHQIRCPCAQQNTNRAEKSAESGARQCATYIELEQEGVARRRHLLELVLHGATHRENRATAAACKSHHRSNISAAATQNTPRRARTSTTPTPPLRGAGRRGLLRS
jgi:hypothetical protein